LYKYILTGVVNIATLRSPAIDRQAMKPVLNKLIYQDVVSYEMRREFDEPRIALSSMLANSCKGFSRQEPVRDAAVKIKGMTFIWR